MLQPLLTMLLIRMSGLFLRPNLCLWPLLVDSEQTTADANPTAQQYCAGFLCGIFHNRLDFHAVAFTPTYTYRPLYITYLR